MLLVTAGMGDGWENSHQHSPSQPSLGHLTWPVPPCEDHDGSSPPGALDATIAHARMGRVAMGGRCATGLCCLHPCQSLWDATEAGLANASERFAQEGRGWQAAPVGVADVWGTGMPPSQCWEEGTRWGCNTDGASEKAQKMPLLGVELEVLHVPS